MTVGTREEAWAEANRIFPTDYMRDDISSNAAGYDVYRSTAEGHFYDYICDLGTSLEVNLSSGSTIRLNIHEPKLKAVTKETAEGLVARYMTQTGYVDDPTSTSVCSRDRMEQMLRGMGFGNAETQTIIGSLVLAGARFYE